MENSYTIIENHERYFSIKFLTIIKLLNNPEEKGYLSKRVIASKTALRGAY